MTVQVKTFNKSKAVLEYALNTQPDQVAFDDPGPWGRGPFLGSHIKVGEHFAVVMDHPKRMRFSQISRDARGFKVK